MVKLNCKALPGIKWNIILIFVIFASQMIHIFSIKPKSWTQSSKYKTFNLINWTTWRWLTPKIIFFIIIWLIFFTWYVFSIIKSIFISEESQLVYLKFNLHFMSPYLFSFFLISLAFIFMFHFTNSKSFCSWIFCSFILSTQDWFFIHYN